MKDAQVQDHGADSKPDRVKRPIWMRLFGHDISAPFFLLVLALLLFVPGQWTVPPLDRDEPRFTQATKQMLESGDYVDIRFQDEARHKKPVGIYWLQAAAVKLTGQEPEAPLWTFRLPSIVGASLAVLASYWLARSFMGPGGALTTGIFIACAIILGVEARLAKTDAMLFFTIVLAQGALARIWLGKLRTRRWGLAFVFWTALAASVLIKGPVGPMVVGLTVVLLVVMDRGLSWFKSAAPLVGLVWFALLVSPWFVAIWIATDGTFFTEAIGKDLLGKVGQGQESHGAPPLTHLAAMFGVFWPLPAFFLLSLPVIWHERKSPLVKFCVAWFLPSWIVFEMVATKLPHYTMPLLPALVLPVAAALVDGAAVRSGAMLRWIAAVVLALPVAGIAAVAFGGPFLVGNWPSPPGAVLCAIAAVFAIMAASGLVRGDPLKALPSTMAAAVFTSIGVWAFVGPALTAIWVSPRLVATMDALPGCMTREVASSGFGEPSFIFLEGTATRIVGPEAAADFLSQTGQTCRIALIESRDETAFLAAAEAIGLVPERLSRVDGLNINGGDELDIGLYRAGGSASERK